MLPGTACMANFPTGQKYKKSYRGVINRRSCFFLVKEKGMTLPLVESGIFIIRNATLRPVVF